LVSREKKSLGREKGTRQKKSVLLVEDLRKKKTATSVPGGAISQSFGSEHEGRDEKKRQELSQDGGGTGPSPELAGNLLSRWRG